MSTDHLVDMRSASAWSFSGIIEIKGARGEVKVYEPSYYAGSELPQGPF